MHNTFLNEVTDNIHSTELQEQMRLNTRAIPSL